MSDLSKVRGVHVAVECAHCHGERRLPGGKYREYGEVVDCPICDGEGVCMRRCTVAELKKILEAA